MPKQDIDSAAGGKIANAKRGRHLKKVSPPFPFLRLLYKTPANRKCKNFSQDCLKRTAGHAEV
jgi:hypothetical protein